jgi:TonB-dependent SusC/RagA subfamily outer membrane receptor
MKKVRKKTLVLAVLLTFSVIAVGQMKTVLGKVTTLDSIPLIGVEIQIKSTNTSVFTDSLGSFRLQCDMEDKLRFKADGFLTQNVKIDENIRVIAVNLKPKTGQKSRQYDIGYGTVSEADRTGAVSGLDEGDTDFTRYKDMYELIRSNFAGVQIRNGEILVRGDKSFNSDNSALIIVDGVINDSDILRQLSPINVKSVNIIKDGSTAVYGSRGANGVVLIETKKGT